MLQKFRLKVKCLSSSLIVCNKRYLNILSDHKPTKISYYCSPAKLPLLSETIGDRLEKAADLFENVESHIFVQSGHRLTFKTLYEKAEKLACGLLSIGVKKGDRVGLWAPNRYEWVVTQFATALIGAIQVNINPAYKANELEYALKKVGCNTIVMTEKFKIMNYMDILSSVCPELNGNCKAGDLNFKKLPKLKNVVVIGEHKFNGCFSFDELAEEGDSKWKKELEYVKSTVDPCDPINIQYTSGTTGSPKGVTLSHHMILNNAFQCNVYLDYHRKNNVKICLPLPLYHCFGMVLGSLATICHGISVVFPSDAFSGEACLKAIEKEKCVSMYGTPTMFVDLINNPNLSKYNLSSFETVIIGGSISPLELLKNCVKTLGVKNVLVGYGMTETSPLITINSVNDTFENKTHTIGKGIEHAEIKVVNKDGKILPLNQAGELLIRGYNTMIGYWDDKKKTDETFTSDRFLKTGDLVTMNDDGYVKFIGRLKELIIRGGENIYPREIEEFIHKHPKVADVYVVGVPDDRLIEEICACIKLKQQGETMTRDELVAYCKDKISSFKIPKYVECVNEFPMTVTGKVQKNVLRDQMIKKLGLREIN